MSTRRYRLHHANAFAAIIVRNDDSRLLSRLGHDHVVRADEFTSTVTIDPGRPEELRFALSFPVYAFVVDDKDDRKRVGLKGKVSKKDRKATRKNMLAKDQLHAERYGNIDFRVDGARAADDDSTWILDASMSVRHRRFEFEFPVSIEFSPQLQVSGRVDITHSDLGLTPYKGPMGTLRNAEEMTLVIEIDASPL